MRVVKRRNALADLEEIAVYLAARSHQAANRFLDAVELTFDALARQPRMGAVYRVENSALVGIRHFQIKGFTNYIVFYMPLDDGIEVFRVLHGARNLTPILERES
jgi:toxin ParE1/3/4